MRPFQDRVEAGWLLAHRVRGLGLENPVVIGLPRGGVAVAAEVAEALDAPLDVIVVRRLVIPCRPDFVFGAVSECGTLLVDPDLVDRSGMSPSTVAEVTAEESAEVLRQVACYRAVLPQVPLAGRPVVIIDDGLATGASARAAVQVARGRGASHVTLAVPVAPPAGVRALRCVADEFVTLVTETASDPIDESYDDFTKVDDAEVVRLLRLAAQRMCAATDLRRRYSAEPGGHGDERVTPHELTA